MAAQQKVAKVGVKRDNNFLYYVKGGDVWRVARKQPGARKGRPEKVASSGIKKETGYIYFVDASGDVSRARMAVGGQKRKKKMAARTRRAVSRTRTMGKRKVARAKRR